MIKISSIAVILTLTAAPLVGQDDPLRDKLELEQSETYKSEAEDRREYREVTNPKRSHSDPHYFEKDHSIKANPIPENPIE